MSYFPDPHNPIKNLILKNPTKREKKVLGALIMFGFAAIITFLVWYLNFHEAGHPLLFYPFTFAVLFLVFRIFFEWYNFLGMDVPDKPELKRQWKVDILTTFCPGEPYKMVETTLLAMMNITYPSKTIYLCDEADDAYLKDFCRRHGIVHVTRKDKSGAKAGNINNALKQATGDICLIMDPDHIPVPEFLDRVLPYFEDEKVGYVQCCQGYYNQEESPIARGACEQTYHFYGPQMMGMGTYGTAQAIGANCTFRRAALDSINGHSWGLAEDMHTSMNLQAKGWKAVYIPEMLSRGLVPADVVAFYKQQLKWARGSFELLFERYPLLFKNFTWRQRFHHLMTPLFYLNGLTSLIFFLLPVLSLIMSDVPVHIDFIEFMAYFIPIIVFQLIVRQYVQRWLYKPQERGFHLLGGILMAGTWWIYIMGFLYSIVRKKVPYIPTPKEGQKKNFFKLIIPHIILIAASVLAILYGLAKDHSPYSWVMAAFASLNCVILTYFTLMCQQRWLTQIENFFDRKRVLSYLESTFKIFSFRYMQLFYYVLRRSAIGIALLVFIFSFINNMDKSPDIEQHVLEQTKEKTINYGGFYIGLTPLNNKELSPQTLGKSLSTSLGEAFLNINISEKTTVKEYTRFFNRLNPSVIPVMQLSFRNRIVRDPSLILKSINAGKADSNFIHFIHALKNYSKPVFITFMDDFPSQIRNQYEEYDFKTAWNRLYRMMCKEGVSNATMAFNAETPKQLDIFYPGDEFVEWVILQVNERNQPEDYSYSVEQLKKPVLFKMNVQERGLNENLEFITSFKYSGGILFSCQSFNSIPEKLERKLLAFASSMDAPDLASMFLAGERVDDHWTARPSPMIRGKYGSFTLSKNGHPFFVRGIAYNVNHDWRDPEMALTRKTLEGDFEKIKSSGANTIRRYGVNEYDINILNVAHEYDLSVIYGFWLAAETDYLKDTAMLLEYEKVVLENVKQFKDHSSILCWTIGNETYGLLKHHYGEPYLTSVRLAYVRFLEHLAKKIKAIDPLHPVLTVVEHNEVQVIEELQLLRKEAPSLDMIGMNAYYEEQISQLDAVMKKNFPGKPYLVTEFGPRGYWHPAYTKFEQEDMVAEDTDKEKARLYADQWMNFILKNKGKTVGGIAYSWTDRFEGTSTWYGITDFKKRIKPSFYALRSVWTKQPFPALSFTEALIKTNEEILFPGRKYEFHADVPGSAGKELHYEWYLRKFEYLEDIHSGIELLNEGTSVRIKIPEEPAQYRLYLHVTDATGHVVTASKGLKTDYAFMDRMVP